MSSTMKAPARPNAVLDLLNDLNSCSMEGDLVFGQTIHANLLETRNNSDAYAVNALINMYRKCGAISDSQTVFDGIQKPNVVHWTTLILGYAENGEGDISLELFFTMKERGVAPNSVTYMAVLKACSFLALNGKQKENCLERGRTIHAEIGCHLNDNVRGSLVDMYSKCGSMVEARSVFSSIEKPDVVSWTALLLGYVENGEGEVALEMFFRMKENGYKPNVVTYVSALKACASMAINGDGMRKASCLERGRLIHLEIGCHLDRYLENTLIDMYSKCGSMVEARTVFDRMKHPDVVSWNVLLLGYAENGEGHISLDLFSRMKAAGCDPDSVTFVASLKACISLAVNGSNRGKAECLRQGRLIHLEVGKNMVQHVQGTLIDMYCTCGSTVEAHMVFDSIHVPNVVHWSTLVSGYVENGKCVIALDLFSRMKASGCTPNSATYVAVLRACTLLGALALGRKIYLEICEFTPHVVTSLVDFYARCGSMVEARDVFNLYRSSRNITTWNVLLGGYGRFGDHESVLKYFKAMQDEGLRPDGITFVCVLLCCSHAGLVEKARELFDAMPVHYGVTPCVIHYTCMVDVLGRRNRLDEAIWMIRTMSCDPDAVIWITLLGACRKWKNGDIGREAFHALADMNKRIASPYVLMANICKEQETDKDKDKEPKAVC